MHERHSFLWCGVKSSLVFSALDLDFQSRPPPGVKIFFPCVIKRLRRASLDTNELEQYAQLQRFSLESRWAKATTRRPASWHSSLCRPTWSSLRCMLQSLGRVLLPSDSENLLYYWRVIACVQKHQIKISYLLEYSYHEMFLLHRPECWWWWCCSSPSLSIIQSMKKLEFNMTSLCFCSLLNNY